LAIISSAFAFASGGNFASTYNLPSASPMFPFNEAKALSSLGFCAFSPLSSLL